MTSQIQPSFMSIVVAAAPPWVPASAGMTTWGDALRSQHVVSWRLAGWRTRSERHPHRQRDAAIEREPRVLVQAVVDVARVVRWITRGIAVRAYQQLLR